MLPVEPLAIEVISSVAVYPVFVGATNSIASSIVYVLTFVFVAPSNPTYVILYSIGVQLAVTVMLPVVPLAIDVTSSVAV